MSAGLGSVFIGVPHRAREVQARVTPQTLAPFSWIGLAAQYDRGATEPFMWYSQFNLPECDNGPTVRATFTRLQQAGCC